MARKKDNCEKGAPKWMVTFSDMTTLLLVFFVMLIASGDVKIVKQMIILSAFEGKMGLLKGGQTLSPGDFESMGQNIESLTSTRKGKSLEKSVKKAVSFFKPEIKSKKIRVIENERGIVVSLFSDAFFEQGSALVRFEDIKGVLQNIRALIDSSGFDGKIRIEGNTDDRPYVGEDYEDNWELSVKRAWSVLKALRDIPSLTEFDESRVSIVGYGSTSPVAGNDRPEDRALNRRVDIVLLRDDF